MRAPRSPHQASAADTAVRPADQATRSTADSTADLPTYVWPLNPWGGTPFLRAAR